MQDVHNWLFYNYGYGQPVVDWDAAIVHAEAPPISMSLFTQTFASLLVLVEYAISDLPQSGTAIYRCSNNFGFKYILYEFWYFFLWFSFVDGDVELGLL